MACCLVVQGFRHIRRQPRRLNEGEHRHHALACTLNPIFYQPTVEEAMPVTLQHCFKFLAHREEKKHGK
eukprot:902836-Amphidinium_carterae.1